MSLKGVAGTYFQSNIGKVKNITALHACSHCFEMRPNMKTYRWYTPAGLWLSICAKLWTKRKFFVYVLHLAFFFSSLALRAVGCILPVGRTLGFWSSLQILPSLPLIKHNTAPFSASSSCFWGHKIPPVSKCSSNNAAQCIACVGGDSRNLSRLNKKKKKVGAFES